MMMRVLARSVRNHRKRTFTLLDAQALLGAVGKGRSSAGNFVHSLRSISAHTLAIDMKPHYGYVPSRWNAADAPSRGEAVIRNEASDCRRQRVGWHDHFVSKQVELARVLRHCRRCGTLGASSEDDGYDSLSSGSQAGQPRGPASCVSSQ